MLIFHLSLAINISNEWLVIDCRSTFRISIQWCISQTVQSLDCLISYSAKNRYFHKRSHDIIRLHHRLIPAKLRNIFSVTILFTLLTAPSSILVCNEAFMNCFVVFYAESGSPTSSKTGYCPLMTCLLGNCVHLQEHWSAFHIAQNTNFRVLVWNILMLIIFYL